MVEDISMFCFNSTVKNLFFNETIIRALISMRSAIFSTNIKRTNINNIFSNEQINIMKEANEMFII